MEKVQSKVEERIGRRGRRRDGRTEGKDRKGEKGLEGRAGKESGIDERKRALARQFATNLSA